MPTSHAFLSSSSEADPVVQSLSQDLRFYYGPSFSFRFWDGSTWTSSSSPPVFLICVKTEKAWKAFRSPTSEIALAKLFVTGVIDVEGSLYAAIRSYPSIQALIGGGSIFAAAVRLFTILSSHVRPLLLTRNQREPAAGMSTSIHAERPYEWYRLWLGNSMAFSAGYFKTFNEELDQAQEYRLERVCDKLQLTEGDRFLDLSSGWGSLLVHAAANHNITAHGLCQDNEQISTTELRLLEAELTKRCSVRFGSYRGLEHIRVPFNKIASICLSEHVEEKSLSKYFRAVAQQLCPGGLFLCDFSSCVSRSEPFSSFLPGRDVVEWECPPLSAVLAGAEAAGLSLVNIEEMTPHYEETLRLWFRSLAMYRRKLERSASRTSVRAWELYIACSAESLRTGHTSFHQLLFRKRHEVQKQQPSDLRWEDGDLYPLPSVSRSLKAYRRASDRSQ